MTSGQGGGRAGRKFCIFVFQCELENCSTSLCHLQQGVLVFHLLHFHKVSFEHKGTCCPSAIEWADRGTFTGWNSQPAMRTSSQLRYISQTCLAKGVPRQAGTPYLPTDVKKHARSVVMLRIRTALGVHWAKGGGMRGLLRSWECVLSIGNGVMCVLGL